MIFPCVLFGGLEQGAEGFRSVMAIGSTYAHVNLYLHIQIYRKIDMYTHIYIWVASPRNMGSTKGRYLKMKKQRNKWGEGGNKQTVVLAGRDTASYILERGKKHITKYTHDGANNFWETCNISLLHTDSEYRDGLDFLLTILVRYFVDILNGVSAKRTIGEGILQFE